MARGCLVAAAILIALMVAVGVLVGPTLYREGKAFVEPVVEMAKSEDAMETLDDEFPFSPGVEDAVISEDRLEAFLAIRRELEPFYRSWRDSIEEVEEVHGESWAGAKEAVISTRNVISGQIAALRAERMSPTEFRWLEKTIYRRWLPAIGSKGVLFVTDEARGTASADLDFVEDLEARYGGSAALDEIRTRLEARLSAAGSGGPAVEGIASATAELLWEQREEIAGLDLDRYELHQILSRGMRSGIHIDGGNLTFDD